VQAEVSPKAKADGLGELLMALQAKADTAALPPVKNYLPARGRAFGSEKYALGPEGFRAAMNSLGQEASKGLTDAVGFQNGAEAMLAGYHGEHGSGVLVAAGLSDASACGATFASSGAGLAGLGKTRGSDGGAEGFPAVGGVCSDFRGIFAGNAGWGELRNASDV